MVMQAAAVGIHFLDAGNAFPGDGNVDDRTSLVVDSIKPEGVFCEPSLTDETKQPNPFGICHSPPLK